MLFLLLLIQLQSYSNLSNSKAYHLYEVLFGSDLSLPWTPDTLLNSKPTFHNSRQVELVLEFIWDKDLDSK